MTRWTTENAPDLPTSEEWCKLAERRLASRRMTQTEAAQTLGVSQSHLSQVLRYKVKHSRTVLPLCELLEMDPPIAVLDIPEVAEGYRLMLELRETSPTLLRGLLRELRAMAGQNSDPSKK